MPIDVQDTIRHYESLRAQLSPWRNTWQRIAELVLPRKSGIVYDTQRTPGQLYETQFTSTAIRANELLAASMQGSLTSSTVRWFALATRSPDLAKDKATLTWLSDYSERLYRNLNASNFHQEIQEVYLDLGAFGTGSLFMDERRARGPLFAGFRFQSREVGTYVVAEDEEGHVDTVYYVMKMSPRAIVKKWGARKAGDLIARKADSADERDQPVEILHGVFPRPGVEGYALGTPATRLPFACVYIDMEQKRLIEEGGYHELPVMVPRWTKISGETMGRGPGFTALGDTSTLNEAVRLNLQSWAISIRPPLLRRHDGVVGTPAVVPGAYIDVFDMEALRPLESGTNHQVNVIERQALQDDIRNAFYWEQLQLPNQQIYTATEVERRLELMQRVLGPTLGRIETELHQKIIMRGVGIMLRAGMRSNWEDPLGAPEPPPQILEKLSEGTAEVDIDYLGPLARAQKSVDAQAVSQTLQIAAPILQIDPDAKVVYDFKAWLRFIAERRGLPPHLVRTEEEAAQIQQSIDESRQQAAQAQQVHQMSEVARNVSPAIVAAREAGIVGGGGGPEAEATAAP